MSISVSGTVLVNNGQSILVECEDGEQRWFSIALDIVEEDRYDADDFEGGDEVDFNITPYAAKKHGLK